MEANYHTPDLFRYSLNSFIRAVKEIPQILKMELQNHREYKTVFKPMIDSLRSNEMLSLIQKKRDFIVHQGMLEMLSKGSVGTTEGRGIKISIPFHVAPSESTQEAYERFKAWSTELRFSCRPKSIRDSKKTGTPGWHLARLGYRIHGESHAG